ncbi:glycosyltransferase family 92 protein [Trichonephila clavata]|uniref:Glycosyltransferase family 92 protein n=1 Tax=Trichonephila clavata TaxID=2740835 RepID=A0A8X6HWP2_TRICU|nr:glycosyltransferase family 92 protein [Trichonephila clavata]
MMNSFQFKDSELQFKEKLFEYKRTLKTDFNMREQIAGMPYWTEILPDIYVYSSYWMYKKSRSLIFTKNTPIAALWKIGCKLHYDNGKHDLNTKTNIILLDRKDSSMFLYLECLPFDAQVPHSVSFVHKNITSTISLPIINEKSYTSPYAVCIQPLPPAFKDVNKVLEFLAFHLHMGIKFFIFYETGLSLNVRKLLMDVAMKNNVYVLLLPWNMPISSNTDFGNKELFFLDCFHRIVARNQSEIVLKLEINDLVVPKGNWNISHFTSFDTAANVFKLHEKVFCEEYPNDIIAQNLFMPFVSLLKTRASNKNNSVKKIVYDVKKLKSIVADSKEFHSWFQKKKVQKAFLIPETFAILHSYGKCGLQSDDENYVEDRSMWKYKDTFFQSHIYKLANEANVINTYDVQKVTL